MSASLDTGADFRVGVIVPSFANSADQAIEVARQAEEYGLHGAFVYDHLWPLGHPLQPAISAFPLLGALAASSTRLELGTLVARIGLVPDRLLVQELETVARISNGRMIAALGIGDQLSAPENHAYGLEFAPVAQRRASLDFVLSALEELGIPSWVGGASSETTDIGRAHGAVINLWDTPPEACAVAAKAGPFTWAGRFPTDVQSAAAQIGALRDAGARWAIYPWPGEELFAAARLAGIIA